MKYKLIIALIFWAHVATAQTGNPVAIAGTKCSMVPPATFVPATRFSGFQNEENGASIMLTELPAPYQLMVEGFTPEALQNQGMKLVSKEIIDHSGSKATLLKITQSANGINYIKLLLLLGTNDYTVIVNGIFPEAQQKIEAPIKAAILTTAYNASQVENPAAGVNFTVDVTGTNFKLAKSMSGNLMYSTDGKIPTVKPTFIAGSSVGGASGDRRRFAEQRLKSLPRGELIVIKQTNEITISGLPGFEIIGDGKNKDGNPILLYQVMLFDTQGFYYILLGQAQENKVENLASFKKIASTFTINK